MVTTSDLLAVPLPNHADSYTTISYRDIMVEVRNQLNANEIEVSNAVHRAANKGQIATGQYFLNYGNDPDIKMMFAWTNSYNKMRAFSCGIGSYVMVCLNGMLSAQSGSTFRRKHTGNAHEEAIQTIQDHFASAKDRFEEMILDKNRMIEHTFTENDRNEMLGNMFMKDIVGSVQLNVVKKELLKPTYEYSGDLDSAWHLYNHVTHALKSTHPFHFADKHEELHSLFMETLGYVPEVEQETTNQLVLTDNLF